MRTFKLIIVCLLMLCVSGLANAYTTPKTVAGFASGLATVGYTLYNPSTGAVAVARTTTGVHEMGATGIYTAAMAGTDGTEYSIVWDDGASHYASDVLRDPALATNPIKAKTDLIATNAADSANQIASQSAITTIQTRLGSPILSTFSLDFAAIPSLVLAAYQASIVDGTLTQKQLNSITANTSLESDRTWNATTHTAVVTWYRRTAGALTADKTKAIKVLTTVYDATNVQIVSQTIALSNLP